ncbi:hypothetical protein DFH27DRAFT_617100 [Peziza echinospora]|nr:hypothetical protein DFH27DRAFT_617100 [Peziza echinospora]
MLHAKRPAAGPLPHHRSPASRRGMKIAETWPAFPKPPRTASSADNDETDSDLGSEPWAAEVTPQDYTGLKRLAASGRLLQNALTVAAVGTEEAVTEYCQEQKKCRTAFKKCLFYTAREWIIFLFPVLGFESRPTSPPPSAPGNAAGWATPAHTPSLPDARTDDQDDDEYDNDETSTGGVFTITKGNFLTDYLRKTSGRERNAINHFLGLTNQTCSTLFSIMSFPARDWFNDIVHNPSLEEIKDLLKHIHSVGHEYTAQQFHWAQVEMVDVFVKVITRLIVPWIGANPRPVREKVSFMKQCLSYWRGHIDGKRVLNQARVWGSPYLTSKRNFMLKGAVDDKVIPGVEEVAMKADKAYVDEKANTKADKAYVDEKANTKADKAYVDEKANTKADKAYVDEKANTKADKAYVDEKANTKADKAYVDEKANTKADKAYVDEKANTKADKAYVDEKANTKADKAYVDEKANTKADKAYVDEKANTKADKADVDKKANQMDMEALTLEVQALKIANKKRDYHLIQYLITKDEKHLALAIVDDQQV